MSYKTIIFFLGIIINLNSFASNSFVFVHIPDNSWNTFITVWNTGEESTTATLKIRNGSEIKEYNLTIAKHGRLFLKSGIDFEIGNSGELVSESNNLQVKLSYQFGNSLSVSEFFIDSNTFGQTFLLQNTIMDWTNWFGMAFFNSNQYSIHITLNAYKEGVQIANENLTLSPFQKKALLSTDIWASLTQANIDTVIVISDSEIPKPLSITGNSQQDRHVFFKGRLLENLTINYRDEMRLFVEKISELGKSVNSNFLVLPQNGQALFTTSGEPDGVLETSYLSAIDGTGREDLFYGYPEDDNATNNELREELNALLSLGENNGVEALVTDYCFTESKMDDSYQLNYAENYISFAATSRGLNIVPTYPTEPFNVNSNDISNLTDAKNFLYLINPSDFGDDRTGFLNTLKNSNYDILLVDLFFNDGTVLTKSEIDSLKTKANGGKRIILCYMSIGEAENYRYYWQSQWATNPPSWLMEENPNWAGNYKVKYWEKEWQNIILDTNSGYLQKILDSDFDGVYLDIIDAFEYFENK